MSKRSHRFRASVEVPELGTVEVRGLSPDALAALPPAVSEGEIGTQDNHGHPFFVAVIVAGCVRPRLSDEQVLALPPTSRDLLADAIMKAHPAGREVYSKYLQETGR